MARTDVAIMFFPISISFSAEKENISTSDLDLWPTHDLELRRWPRL